MYRKLLAATAVAALFSATPLLPTATAQEATSLEPSLKIEKQIPPAVFGRLPFMQNPLLSPDGRKIAVKLSRDGADYLAVVDITDPDAKPDFFIAAEEYREVGDRTVGSWRWVGNDTVVVTLYSRENIFGDRADLSRLIAYDIKEKKLRPLAWEDAAARAADILHIDHENETILLERDSTRYGSENYFNPEVIRVDVTTGKYETVMRPNPIVDDWAADGQGVVRAGYGYDPDSGKTRVLYRSGAGENLSTVYNEADPTFSGEVLAPEIFLPEEDMAIVTSNEDGYRKVYKVDMKELELGEPLFGVDGYDIYDVMTDRGRDQLVGVTVVEEGYRRYYFDEKLKVIQEQILDETFGKGMAFITSSNLDNTKFVIGIGDSNQAGSFYLYDTTTGAFNLLGHSRPDLEDAPLNPVSTIRYPASDGETVPAVLTMPRHRLGQKNLPLVILTHGGPFGPRDAESFDSWAQMLAELGYVVVQPNYRGSGGYGKEWLMKGRRDGFGFRMQDDLNDAITYLARQDIVDPDRVCMMGWSYGGYAAARAAQRDPDKYRCAIAGAGVYDLKMMRRYDRTYLGKFGQDYLSKGEADLDLVSPAQNAEGDWAPIMIVHGVRDQRVPVEQARKLVDALKDSGKVEGRDFAYVEQPKNTHHLPYENVHIEWLEAAARWLQKHNPPYIPGDADEPVPVDTRFVRK
ncbi:MAG: alpha/beta hydrolase family protein [Sphingomonadaceae bacterium]